jgi:hypothetical protein
MGVIFLRFQNNSREVLSLSPTYWLHTLSSGFPNAAKRAAFSSGLFLCVHVAVTRSLADPSGIVGSVVLRLLAMPSCLVAYILQPVSGNVCRPRHLEMIDNASWTLSTISGLIVVLNPILET